jgi:hypothetical protein
MLSVCRRSAQQSNGTRQQDNHANTDHFTYLRHGRKQELFNQKKASNLIHLQERLGNEGRSARATTFTLIILAKVSLPTVVQIGPVPIVLV